ncbi:ATP-binding protein [Streptomyces chartreusis]|uniref:ATP-binding protein n=1 Tax=Streptomyces chartreusis TaxID=1969 RepID=UPI0036CF56E6
MSPNKPADTGPRTTPIRGAAIAATSRALHHLHGAKGKDPPCLVLPVEGDNVAEVPRVRRRVRTFLSSRQVPETIVEKAVLVVSELVTNAVIHAVPPISLHVHSGRQFRTRIEVQDGGPRTDPRATEAEDEHGRGLQIVAAECDRHGRTASVQGVTHWAEVT